MNMKGMKLMRAIILRTPISRVRKHYLYRRMSRMLHLMSQEEAIPILVQRRFFLITSTGRTATLWLSCLLSDSEGVFAPHEPVIFEEVANAEALKNPLTASTYIHKFRLHEMAYWAKEYACYGEVNGMLRRHLEALRGALPEIKIIRIIRNGHDYVRSVLARKTWTDRDPIYGQLIPHHTIISADNWKSMDRFERLCFMWNAENRYMEKFADSTIRFEDMLSSYSVFKEKVLDVIGLSISKSRWQESIKNKLNATKVHKAPTHEYWSDMDKAKFESPCDKH